jgi:hypothetical protein
MNAMVRVVFGVGALVLLPTAAPAWNSVGHMAVGKVAFDRLDASEQLKIFNLLKKHPHYEKFLAAGRPDDIGEVQWVVMRAGVWPDWVRPRRKDNRGADVIKYHRGEDHYVNVPIIAPGSEEFFAGKTLISPDLPNILTALKSRCNDIRTRTAADEDKAIAICWVFHLIGDIHQPMHNVSYFSSDRAFQSGDLGGNKFGVRDGTKKWKLHAYWDDLLGVDRDYNDDAQAHQVELYKSAVKVADRLRGLELVELDMEQLTKNTTFDSWSKESFELAKAVAYRKGDDSGLLNAVEAPFEGPIPEVVPELGEDYVKRARATAEKRIVFAGRRLAERMKMLLPGK